MASMFPDACAHAIRFLAADAVELAQSGHPGMPLGMAEVATVLWQKHLRHNPKHPLWFNRDRFVLSNGHGSMLLYAVLHLTGYEISINDLKQFRRLHAKTAGHPEYREAPGIETTTGPLGQGLANAVGFAWAEQHLAARFNRPGFPLVEHFTWVFVGDGCLMEGISHEVASLAGVWGLGRLIVLYDDNGISIDGHVEAWFSDDTPARFSAYGWHVISDVDGHDPEAIDAAIQAAKSELHRPSLICCKTIIGRGAPHKAGDHDVHGAPLGAQELAAMRQTLAWPHPAFHIPQEIYEAWNACEKGAHAEQQWCALWQDYQNAHPDLAQAFSSVLAGFSIDALDEHVANLFADISAKQETVATRKASHSVLNVLAPHAPFLVGGSADLTPSNLTRWQGAEVFSAQQAQARYIHFGVREFGMAAIVNGIQLHSGLKAFAATFLMFSEYARNAVRMAALMRIAPIFVFTHDSIGLGEDGPTHQPVEQAATLRLLPNLSVWRPADAMETAVAWQSALSSRTRPHALLLSRQALPVLPWQEGRQHLAARGAYVVWQSVVGEQADLVLVATGSEVSLALDAAQQLSRVLTHKIQVVSMPCCDVFDQQEESYRESVLPAHAKKMAIEAGSTGLWWRYVGTEGCVLGMDQFGASAPAEVLFEHFGFSVVHIVERVHAWLGV